MKRLVFLCLAALVASPAAFAEGSFVWQVDGARARHYLAGSIHILPQNAHPLPPAFDKAYAASKIVVIESIGVTTPEDRGGASYVRLLGDITETRPGGLPARVGEQRYASFKIHAERLNLSVDKFQHFKPWFAAQMLESFSSLGTLARKEFGVDYHYYWRALSDRKLIHHLESEAAHDAIFAGMSEEASLQYFSSALEGAEDAQGQLDAIINSWRAGDRGLLQQRTLDMKARYPLVHERVLAERNRAWVPVIRKMLSSSEPHFIIAGAAHFVGPDNVIQLLEAQGVRPREVHAVPDAAPGI